MHFNNDEQRYDPILGQKVRTLLEGRTMAVVEASRLLEEARQVLASFNNIGSEGGHSLYDDAVIGVIRAMAPLDNYTRMLSAPTETYVTNMAANSMGDSIISMGDKFQRITAAHQAQLAIQAEKEASDV